MQRFKYQRTPHLTYSPGFSADDVFSIASFEGREVVITEKLDGENTTCYSDGALHARSIDSKGHPSRDWIKAWWGNKFYYLPDGWRVCGENVYAKHSIAYDQLEGYFYAFSVWDKNNVCLSWDDTISSLASWDILPVRVLWRGLYNEDEIKRLIADLDLTKQEGIVLRVADSFTRDEFPASIAKWVRKNHVTTDEHWMHQAVVPNKLKST